MPDARVVEELVDAASALARLGDERQERAPGGRGRRLRSLAADRRGARAHAVDAPVEAAEGAASPRVIDSAEATVAPQGASAPSEIDALKAKRAAARTRKQIMADERAEVEILKSKVADPHVPAAPKKLLGASGSEPAKRVVQPDDAARLKEKLTSTKTQRRPTEEPRPAPVIARRRPPLESRLRAAEAPPGSEPARASPAGTRTAAPAPAESQCEIVWWRGYTKSQFMAITGRDDPNHALAVSPFFGWRKSDPPPETPAASRAVRALVEALEQEGWVISGRGRRWFSVRLRLSPPPDRTERLQRPVPRQAEKEEENDLDRTA